MSSLNSNEIKDIPSKKCVTFDENIEIIGISEPHIDRENERKILEHLKFEYQAEPQKLFSENSKSAPSQTIVSNLQNLMAQKLNIVKKCDDAGASSEKKCQIPATESSEEYIKDTETGAWISKSQLEAKQKIAKLNEEFKNPENSLTNMSTSAVSVLKPLKWNSFEELQQISESNMSSDLRKWQIIPEFPFCNEIAKLYTTAKEFDIRGDEEEAFIWYYKYCEFEKLHDDEYFMENVWKCSCGLDCSHCDIFHQQLSLKTSKKQLKILTKSLKNRYDIEET